jgi:hypothetical protein
MCSIDLDAMFVIEYLNNLFLEKYSADVRQGLVWFEYILLEYNLENREMLQSF